MAESQKLPIQSLETKDELISILIESDGAGVSEVAERLGKPTSTTHDYLRTLEELGYLMNVDGEYEVSTRFLAIGTKVRARNRLYAASKDEIRELAEELDERIMLMKEEGGYGIVMYSTEKDDSLKINPRGGGRTVLHAGAGGKAILSELERERVERIIERRGLDESTPKTITSEEELFDELEKIREQGYAVDRGEGVKGIRGVAVSISAPPLSSVGAIMAYGPANRFPDERIEEVTDDLLQVKNIIEFNLSYQEYQPI